MLYTVYVSVYSIAPMTGSEAAAKAWDLSREQLEGIIPPGPPDTVLQEIRAAFAAWCSIRERSLFADLESAWNEFIAPRHGLPGRAVYLPGNPCPECRQQRFKREELNRVAYQDCKYCRGMGHLPPRAIPSRLAPVGAFTPRHIDSVENTVTLS